LIAAGILSSCDNEAELNFKRYYSSGQVIYQTRCQNCHGNNGEGLGALIPPLSDSVSLKTRLHSLACFVKNGLKHPITSNGKTYSQPMPAQNDLSSIEIAQVLTYVNNSFNNKLGLIDVQQVNNDLQKCP